MTPTSFQDRFFNSSMHQQFNSLADADTEAPLRRWLRTTGQL